MTARRAGADEEVVYRAKYVIAADGPRSDVVAKLYPAFRDSIPWFVVGQKYYDADLDLDPQWFHFTINSQLGYYTWTHAENGVSHRRLHRQARRAVAEGARDGGRVPARSSTGCGSAERCSKEGCLENFGMSLTNNFVFGERRVLVTGQAAGFLNMMAEGMSCAMHSGAIAGESIVESFTRNRDANAVYDDLDPERARRAPSISGTR